MELVEGIIEKVEGMLSLQGMLILVKMELNFVLSFFK
jgi:hypothetical protein